MANFEDTINELVDATGDVLAEAGDSAEGASSGCFSPVPPLNPINEIILAVFGENYFPPYSTEFQPEKKGLLTNEKLLQMQLPGGGKIRPIATPLHNSIADYITPISGLLGSVFNFFGPLFIILDVLRAIIDIICTLFNPLPLIASMVELFVNVLPPLIALYPPLSSILLALNTIKLILSIVAAMIAHLTPIIDKLVANALSITSLLAEGNLGAIDAVTAKICTLITHLENEIGALLPIQFIIELLQTFMDLGSKLFCFKGPESDSPCCDDANCPQIITNPPTGRAIVLRDQNRFSFLDLFNIYIQITYFPLFLIDEFIEFTVNSNLFVIETAVNLYVGAYEIGINILLDTINLLLTITPGSTELLEAAGIDLTDASVDLSPLTLDFPELDLPSPNSIFEALELIPFLSEALAGIGLDPAAIEAVFDSIDVIPAETEILMLTTAGNSVAAQGLPTGTIYTVEELATLQNFIVHPDKIPAPQTDEDPSSIYCRMVRASDGLTVTAPVSIPPKGGLGQFLSTVGPNYTGVAEYPGNQLLLRTDAFNVGDEIDFWVEPDYEALLALSLIGLGCHPDVQSAAQGLAAYINADVDSAAATGGSGNDDPGAGEDEGFTGFDPVSEKINANVPLPPLDALADCLALQAADPSINQTDCFIDVLGDYIQELTDFYDSVVCVGVSRIQSEFNSSKDFALVGANNDSVTITLSVKDIGGNNLLLGAIPTSTFRVEWYSTLGTFGPTLFDSDTGIFSVTLTSEEAGLAEVTAAFIVNDKVCMRPGLFDGFTVTDKIIIIEFIPEEGTHPRRRKERQYVHSRGGRRR
jgi:hypothetical protein